MFPRRKGAILLRGKVVQKAFRIASVLTHPMAKKHTVAFRNGVSDIDLLREKKRQGFGRV